MTCAPALAGLRVLTALGVLAAPTADPAKADRTAQLVNLSPFVRGTVRRALDLARDALTEPECPRVYADFKLEDGTTPRDELDRRGLEPADLLETLVFMDGSPERVCRAGRSALITKPGGFVIWVCPLFTRLAIASPLLSANLVIHESLHTLGLREDPPRSIDITRAVERRCWRRGRAAGSRRER